MTGNSPAKTVAQCFATLREALHSPELNAGWLQQVWSCLTETQLSLFRSSKVRGIRFSTLAKLCAALECQPADLLIYDADPGDLELDEDAI